jgi:hypothetical protein
MDLILKEIIIEGIILKLYLKVRKVKTEDWIQLELNWFKCSLRQERT